MASTTPAEDITQRKRLRVDEKSSVRDRSRDKDRSHWRRFHDSAPLDRSSDDFGRRRRAERRSRSPGRHRSSDTRSRSYYQLDEHRNAVHGNKPDVPRVSAHGRYNDLKDELDNKVLGRPASDNLEKKDEKSQPQDDNEKAWKHDGYYELESEAASPVRKRPAFREKKMQVEDGALDVAESGSARPSHHGGLGLNSDKREEVRGYNPRVSSRYDRPSAGRGDRDLRRRDLVARRSDTSRYGYQPRDRYDNAGGARIRDNHNVRYNGRNSFQPGGLVEKWKHDLFDEANKSPSRKNEEEQIAKAEALLAL